MSAVAGSDPKIGIALSGGGARAIAFHLGCLRALHNRGVLQRAQLMATVSGGSVIGAMYACHEGSFAEFETNVRAVLRRGFVGPALETAFTTSEGLKAATAFALLLASWAWLVPLRWMVGLLFRIATGGRQGPVGVPAETRMPRRFASRTTILQHTIERLIFKGKRLGDLATDRPRLVIIATELRTGSAFYFGRQHAGSWRFGTIDPAQIPVAHAVMASAAYPLLLPALDEYLTFRRRDGSLRTERVTLTDGGVYDNLGLAPLWPDRDREISVGVEEIDTIVACRAGYGLRVNDPSLFAGARLRAAFATVHARAQNATMKRLFDLKNAGAIQSFVLPYLDQDDERLAFPPDDLVRRTAVADYPTDFSAMPDVWIEKLAKRGEQLTLAVLREHAPHLLRPADDRDSHQPIAPAPMPDASAA